MLKPAIVLMGVALAGLLIVTIGSGNWFPQIERPYLIPWVLAMGIVIAAPTLYLKYRNEFSFVNPLFLAGALYFFPMFFLGGWSLTFGFSHYYYLNYVADPEYNFPLALIYAAVGYAALAAGYFIPKGKSVGNFLSSKLPKWEFTPVEIVIACTVCLAVGFGAIIVALEFGQVGYQMGDIVFGETGSLVFYMTIIVPTSSFLLWIAFFRFEEWNLFHVLIAVVQIFTALFLLMVYGGKGSLVGSVALAIIAFVFVKGKIQAKHLPILVVVLFLGLVLGTIYGTKFRTMKGSTARVSVAEYSLVAFESMGQIGEGDTLQQIEESLAHLAHRLETVSALAVVVSNYEALSPYEASYGLENNIWTYTWTAFIPRFLWKDKPIIADGLSYNELYFDHRGFGLSLTVMGDLLRNFGPVGIPLGMILLGFGIRVLYSALIEGLSFSTFRSTLYFMILSRISYDGFYGEILPTVIRVAVVVLVQFVVLKMVIQVLRHVKARA